MDIKIKIHQGTGSLTGESMCLSCNHGARWVDSQGEHMSCGADGSQSRRQIKGRVVDCTDYLNRGLPSLFDMRVIAWTLRTEKGGKMIGFQPPKAVNHGPPDDD